MKSMLKDNVVIPTTANFVQHGAGTVDPTDPAGPPVVMVHGIAASLHDWDDLIPELTKNGHTSYALDLLGHGESPKLNFTCLSNGMAVRTFFKVDTIPATD